jgi:hypothetical protein
MDRRGRTAHSPTEVVYAVQEKVWGDPDSDWICKSHIERQILSIRKRGCAACPG